MKFEFDGENKIIQLVKEDEDDDNNPILEAEVLYAEWKKWLDDDIKNMGYLQAMRSTGGDPLSKTKNIAPYYEVMNGWKIKPYDGNYVLSVVGNLFGTEGAYPFTFPDDGSVMVNLETTGNAYTIRDYTIIDQLLPSWDTDTENCEITYYDRNGRILNRFKCFDKQGKPSLSNVRKMERVQ